MTFSSPHFDLNIPSTVHITLHDRQDIFNSTASTRFFTTTTWRSGPHLPFSDTPCMRATVKPPRRRLFFLSGNVSGHYLGEKMGFKKWVTQKSYILTCPCFGSHWPWKHLIGIIESSQTRTRYLGSSMEASSRIHDVLPFYRSFRLVYPFSVGAGGVFFFCFKQSRREIFVFRIYHRLFASTFPRSWNLRFPQCGEPG